MMHEQAPVNRQHFRIVALCAGVMFMDGLDLLTISFAAPALAKALGFAAYQIGYVFSAGLLGVCVGSVLIGLLSDRSGRKPALLLSVFLFAMGSLLTGTAEDLQTILAYRFLTGLGLGGATPVVLALITEACPSRTRASLSMVAYCGLMVGGLFAAALCAVLLERWPWSLIFYIGGAVPLLYLPVLMRWLPESREFQRVIRTEAPRGELEVLGRTRAESVSLRRLFEPDTAARTWLTTVGLFCSLSSLHFYGSWLPALLLSVGMTQQQAIVATSAGGIGNLVGSLIIARLILSQPPYRVVAITYVGACLALLAVSVAPAEMNWQLPLNFMVGFLLAGSLNAFLSLAPQLFPSEVRTTGVGFARGVGQVGSVLAPSVAGLLLAQQWTSGELLRLSAVPPLVCALSCWCLYRLGSYVVTRDAIARAKLDEAGSHNV